MTARRPTPFLRTKAPGPLDSVGSARFRAIILEPTDGQLVAVLLRGKQVSKQISGVARTLDAHKLPFWKDLTAQDRVKAQLIWTAGKAATMSGSFWL